MRLVAMAQAGYMDPMDPTLPRRIQARDPLSVALPQLPPVRLAPAHEASSAAAPTLSPPMQPVVVPSAAALPQQQQPQAHDDGEEEEDEFGDFESASASPPPVQAAPAPIPSMPTPSLQPLEPQQPPVAAVTVQAAADEEADDFGDFNAAEAGMESSVGLVATSSSTTSVPGAPTTFEAVAVSASTIAATVATTMSPTGGMTGLAILSSQTLSVTTTSSSSSSLPTPTISMAPAADIGARMAAFDAIVEESDWGDFEEADAPAAASVAPAAPQAAPTPPLAFTANGLIAEADMLMGLAGEEKEGTAQPPALPFGGIVSTGGAGGGGGGLLDLDLLAPPSTAATADPFAMAAPVVSSAPPSFGAPAPGLDVLGGSTGGGGTVMSQLMTETPPSSPKAVQPHENRSPSPPLPSIRNLDLDPSRGAAGGNPFASAAATAAAVGRPFSSSSPGPFADTGAGAGGLRMGSDGGRGGSLVGLAGAGIGTGSIYEQSPYADPDAAVPQGPSPLLGAASPPLVAGGGGGVPKAAKETEDALTSAFKAVDAMTSAGTDVGFAAGLGDNSSSTSGSHTGPFSPPPSSVPPLPFFASAPSAAPAMGGDLFGFSGEEASTAAPAAPAPVFGGSSGADEWGAFNGGGISAQSTAPVPTLVSAPLALASVPAPAPASDDPFAGLQGEGEEETAMAAGAIQHEEVSPSSRGSSSPDRPMGSKGVEAAVPAAATAVQEEEDDEWGAFSTAKEETPVPAPTPITPVATSTSAQEPADPWSHPDPWGAVVPPPVATGAGGGGSGAAAASASASSILLDPLHVVAPPEAPATAHEDDDEEGALAAVLPRLWAKGLLGAAAALTEHLEAGRALPGVAAACEEAKREDRLEEALALKRRMRELEGRVAGAGQLAAWRALGAGEDAAGGQGQEEGGDVLLERLRRQVEAGAGAERAEAFARAFIAGQPSLAAQAQDGDARGALRRARRARRCAALIVGMAAAADQGEQGVGGGGGGGPLAAYPRHWQRTLATAAGKLGEAAAFCRRVAALPSAKTRREVGASLKVRNFVEASLEILRVARFVRASAGEALLELEEEGENEGVEALAEALQTILGEMGLEAAVAAGWPLVVEAVRDAVVDCGGEDEEEEAAAPAVDPRSVCNLCLLPLAAARKLGGGAAAYAPVPVTYFSGAGYHSACCNLWLNAISLETPQPVAFGGNGLMGMAGGLSGDAMDGSTSSGRVSVESGIRSNGGGAAAVGAALSLAALAEGKALEAEVPF